MTETPRMKQLKSLAGNMPIANQQVASGLQEAQKTQFQQAIKGAAPSAGATAAQAVGGQVAGQQAGAQVAANQATQKQAQQVGQIGLAQQQTEAAQRVGSEQRDIQAQQRDFQNRLNGLDQTVKQELFDKNLAFAKDEQNRAFFNDRQLADWAVSNAKSEIEFNKYKAELEKATSRSLQMLEAAHNQVKQTLSQGYTSQGKRLDQATQKQLAQAEMDLKAKIEKQKRKAAANAAMWQAGGTIAGAAAGAAMGGPAGAVVGASVGGALGGAAGSQF